MTDFTKLELMVYLVSFNDLKTIFQQHNLQSPLDISELAAILLRLLFTS